MFNKWRAVQSFRSPYPYTLSSVLVYFVLLLSFMVFLFIIVIVGWEIYAFCLLSWYSEYISAFCKYNFVSNHRISNQ